MAYELQYSSASPGLLILLTDELEESVQIVNSIIDKEISIHFDGAAPRNRCFISVIGYNHNVKELCSGWLKDLATRPLRFENLKKKMSDGTGGIVEVDVKQPIWVEPTQVQPSKFGNYAEAVNLAREL